MYCGRGITEVTESVLRGRRDALLAKPQRSRGEDQFTTETRRNSDWPASAIRHRRGELSFDHLALIALEGSRQAGWGCSALRAFDSLIACPVLRRPRRRLRAARVWRLGMSH